MRLLFNIISLLGVTLLLTSCATQSTQLTQINKSPLKDNYGYIVTRIKSNSVTRQSIFFKDIHMKKSGSTGAYLFHTSGQSRTQILKVPAGQYRWIEFNSPVGWRELNAPTFKILANKINYIGDIDISVDIDIPTLNISVQDNRETMKQELMSKVPSLLDKYPLSTSITTIINGNSNLTRDTTYLPPVVIY